jgi:pyruvate-formate lyase-activating enzyme
MIDHGYKKLHHTHETAKNAVVVNWCITDVCNYRCTYCLPSLHEGRIGVPNYDTVLNFCKKVIDAYSPQQICFEFTGGEVTIWHRFPDLVRTLKEYPNVAVGIISNGSRNTDFWGYMRDLKVNQVCLSFQPEMADPEHYLEIVKLLSGNMRTHVNIMMHPKYFEDSLYVANEIATNYENVSMALQPLLVEFKDQLFDYTEKQLGIIEAQHELFGARVKWTKYFPVYRGSMDMIYDDKVVVSSAHRFIGDKSNRWTGWKCYAGVEQIVVDLEGMVWRGWCKEGGCLGSIEGEVKLKPEPIICQRDYCHCNFDIMCTKEKI